MALKEEFEYYLTNQSEFVKKYAGKVLAIKGLKVIGVYQSEIEALQATKKVHEVGTFLIQRCTPGTTDTVVTYYTQRVAFG